MSQRELQRLLDLLAMFSATTKPDEGALRDEIARVRAAVYDRRDHPETS
jgi:hypothetical protein